MYSSEDLFLFCLFQSKEDKVENILEKKSIENMLNFLSIYEEKSTHFQDEILSLKMKIEQIDKEIAVLTENLSKLEPKRKEKKYQRYDVFFHISISIFVKTIHSLSQIILQDSFYVLCRVVSQI